MSTQAAMSETIKVLIIAGIFAVIDWVFSRIFRRDKPPISRTLLKIIVFIVVAAFLVALADFPIGK